MAKNKVKPTNETAEIEKADEVLTVVDTKNQKESKQEKKAVAQKTKQTKKKKERKPRRNWFKEIFSELKKVNWPSFGKTCAQTGAVLVVVGMFMLAVLGIDSLVSWIISLITKI